MRPSCRWRDPQPSDLPLQELDKPELRITIPQSLRVRLSRISVLTAARARGLRKSSLAFLGTL